SPLHAAPKACETYTELSVSGFSVRLAERVMMPCPGASTVPTNVRSYGVRQQTDGETVCGNVYAGTRRTPAGDVTVLLADNRFNTCDRAESSYFSVVESAPGDLGWTTSLWSTDGDEDHPDFVQCVLLGTPDRVTGPQVKFIRPTPGGRDRFVLANY